MIAENKVNAILSQASFHQAHTELASSDLWENDILTSMILTTNVKQYCKIVLKLEGCNWGVLAFPGGFGVEGTYLPKWWNHLKLDTHQVSPNASGEVMVSYDIKALFTSVLVDPAINIVQSRPQQVPLCQQRSSHVHPSNNYPTGVLPEKYLLPLWR